MVQKYSNNSLSFKKQSFGLVNLLLIFIVFPFQGCEDEKATGSRLPDDATSEEKYFEDYEKQKYKWGFIGQNNEIEIKAQFDDTRDFHEGLAAVNYKGKWGFINANGKKLIDYIYRSAFRFENGIARVQDFNGQYLYLNKKGNNIFRRAFVYAADFKDGFALVGRPNNYCYINVSGDTLKHMIFDKAKSFNYGFGVVKKGAHFGVIDKNGQQILDFQYDRIKVMSSDWIRIKKNSHYQIYDVNKSLIHRESYDKISTIHKRAAIIFDKKSWYCLDIITNEKKYLDSKIKEIVDGGMERLFAFDGNRFAILDNNGMQITEYKYDIIQRFNDQRAAFAIDDKWGYLDIQGNEVIPAIYPLVFDFIGEKARVVIPGGIGFIDLDGNETIKPQYFEVKDFYEGLARYQDYNSLF